MGLILMVVSISSQQLEAADIKTLIMPGDLVTGHAELEAECSSCHAAFKKTEQTVLCLDCHEEIANDVETGAGFHGRSDDVKGIGCRECHTDHIGRDADIVNLVKSTFEHDATDFELLGSHAEVECTDCHAPDLKYREAPHQCVDCHKENDAHDGNLGDACADCHNESSWKEADFDHSQTDYPLIGKHLDTECDDCHRDNVFDDTPDDCFSCHVQDDVHKGLSGKDCGSCHNPRGWDDTSFDHRRDTDFALDGAHAEIACGDCHSDQPFSDKLDTSCISCHQEDDEHKGHFGVGCEGCHTSRDWTSIRFDHARDTNYALKGAHLEADCKDCHVDPIFDVALESACIDCHADDDAHEGDLGAMCQDCHNEVSWTKNVVFDHDLTHFQLLGKHLDTECDDCHESKVFSQAGTACIDCHQQDDPHQGRYSGACEGCHNPVDWNIWFFDHNTQTDFLLDGAHVSVDCQDCHRQPIESMVKLGTRCGDCHRADDVHDGEFGAKCERCHSSTSFKDVRLLR